MKQIRLSNALDITVKSGDKVFAPTWRIVMALKNGEISWKEYEAEYRQMMQRSQNAFKDHWIELLQKDSVTLICYCQKPEQCHRSLLAEMLVTFAEENRQIAINHGEIGKQ